MPRLANSLPHQRVRRRAFPEPHLAAELQIHPTRTGASPFRPMRSRVQVTGTHGRCSTSAHAADPIWSRRAEASFLLHFQWPSIRPGPQADGRQRTSSAGQAAAVPIVRGAVVSRAQEGPASPAGCAERTGRQGQGADEVPEQGKMGSWVPCQAAQEQTGRGSGLPCQAAGSGPSSPFQAMTA